MSSLESHAASSTVVDDPEAAPRGRSFWQRMSSMLLNEHPGPDAPMAPPYTGNATADESHRVPDFPPHHGHGLVDSAHDPAQGPIEADEDRVPDTSWLASLQPPSNDELLEAEADTPLETDRDELESPATACDPILSEIDQDITPPIVAEIGGSALFALPDLQVEVESVSHADEPVTGDEETEEFNAVEPVEPLEPVVPIEVNEAMVVPSLQDPPEIDDDLANDLRRDLDSSMAWSPELLQHHATQEDSGDEGFDADAVDSEGGPLDGAQGRGEEALIHTEDPENTEGPADSSSDDLLAMIALGHHRRSRSEPTDASALDSSATIELPDRAHGRNDVPLDSVIDALHIVAVSAGQARGLLPHDAITSPVSDGLVGAVAIVRGGSIDFVGEARCERWSITPAMIGCVADSNTRADGRISRDVVLVDGSETVVLESRLPVAATALGFLEEFVEVPLPVGALVLVASSNLVVIQASRSRSPAAVETLLEFAREERGKASTALELTVMVQSPDGLDVVGDLGSAAGRLGMAAAVERLTGA